MEGESASVVEPESEGFLQEDTSEELEDDGFGTEVPPPREEQH